jgi:hypothetical protein
LGGDVGLYVDNAAGYLTADELARVADGVAAVDAVLEPFGVTISLVSDPALADVTLDMGTTSDVGGYSDGVLGCTTDAGRITLIVGWDWYAGSDPTHIGAGQYDFQTVVTHELGHALGLGHRSDPTSVMYATLGTGVVKRALVVADLNVPDSDGGPGGLHAAPTAAVGTALTEPVPAAAALRIVVSGPKSGGLDPILVSTLETIGAPAPSPGYGATSAAPSLASPAAPLVSGPLGLFLTPGLLSGGDTADDVQDTNRNSSWPPPVPEAAPQLPEPEAAIPWTRLAPPPDRRWPEGGSLSAAAVDSVFAAGPSAEWVPVRAATAITS